VLKKRARRANEEAEFVEKSVVSIVLSSAFTFEQCLLHLHSGADISRDWLLLPWMRWRG
jgi:hypothetical protein